MEAKIYHNPRCTKSRNGLSLLSEQGVKTEIIEYLKEPLDFKELKAVITKLGIAPYQLLRRNEADFKAHFKGKELSDDQWIQAMIDYPKLMERPIVVVGNNAVIGRPTEKILELIG
ncbi:MAG: arsenate reductase (glutaredoxin) [Bacteroidia bacterium]